MNVFQKTSEEKAQLRTAKSNWKQSIKDKYPNDSRCATAIWLSNLVVNAKI
tara:strand:- start:2156 stop:2308 length:153 start_codon:yes stop_codon:yes gene_type:complete